MRIPGRAPRAWCRSAGAACEAEGKAVSTIETTRTGLFLDEYGHFINGEWVASQGGRTIALSNPATGRALAKIPSHCPPVFQHRYLLSRLSREGYRLALCSNSVRQSVDEMIRAADLERFFEVTLSNEDIKEPKPDPEIYRTAAKRMKVQPDRCLVVADNGNGIQSAKAAGMHVLEVADPEAVTYERIAQALQAISAKRSLQ